MNRGAVRLLYLLGVVALVVSFLAVLFIGSVGIPPREIMAVLTGRAVSSPYVATIVLETRLPMAICALCCGATLSVAGLVMQTTFHNPLAGPSVLGISSGASFGVAVLMLSAGGMSLSFAGGWQPLMATACALLGGLAVMLILFSFSAVLKSGVSLLIVGIMIGYLCSSGISLLNYFSPADEIRSFLVWGLGSFSGLRLSESLWLLAFSLACIVTSFSLIKVLNAYLMGERYVESIGYSIGRSRILILFLTGCLVAVPTAFCGPIGFIGLIVPHLARLMFRSSNHLVLLPATALYGGVVALLCALLSVAPAAGFGILPINVITPVIGVPVILYLLIRRSRLPYFS